MTPVRNVPIDRGACVQKIRSNLMSGRRRPILVSSVTEKDAGRKGATIGGGDEPGHAGRMGEVGLDKTRNQKLEIRKKLEGESLNLEANPG